LYPPFPFVMGMQVFLPINRIPFLPRYPSFRFPYMPYGRFFIVSLFFAFVLHSFLSSRVPLSVFSSPICIFRRFKSLPFIFFLRPSPFPLFVPFPEYGPLTRHTQILLILAPSGHADSSRDLQPDAPFLSPCPMDPSCVRLTFVWISTKLWAHSAPTNHPLIFVSFATGQQRSANGLPLYDHLMSSNVLHFAPPRSFSLLFL